ncbi:hypothetical protein CVT24_009656 [Panaeolus cyanescens]|uniref:Uncharacterized protein n=1 Tax=Panaeolus cyanescens TaxID=181874 RepID=A0A409Y9M1_9AGAR|nr:hypothetical protein CVT24_009656 [Panaeolus cyanescens]
MSQQTQVKFIDQATMLKEYLRSIKQRSLKTNHPEAQPSTTSTSGSTIIETVAFNNGAVGFLPISDLLETAKLENDHLPFGSAATCTVGTLFSQSTDYAPPTDPASS